MRQGHSIEEVILEKRLIYDISRMNRKPIAQMITDLEACHDRELSQIAGMVEELVGIKRAGIKLIVKILLILKHKICTGFGISIESYHSNKYLLGGTGQGNRFSGDSSRDISCFMIKVIKENEWGTILQSLIDYQYI